MSGSPSEAEVQTMLQNAVDVLETYRSSIDESILQDGGPVDVLIQSLEGVYAPSMADGAAAMRQEMSVPIEPSGVQRFLDPVLFEYGRIITDFGGGYTDRQSLMRALYDWFDSQGIGVQSRTITYDTTPTVEGPGGSNVGGGGSGNAELTRLSVDENGYNLEACHVEKKVFKCIADQNTGTDKWAEIFECIGAAASPDALLRASYGGGVPAQNRIRSAHAGSTTGGSSLNNSSFSDFESSAFTNWTETTATGNIAQDVTNYYRPHPGASTNASLQITGGGGTVTMKQTLPQMRINALDPDAPYFLRVMLNKTVGTASGGTVTIRMGSASASTTIAGLGSGWRELRIASGQGCWPRAFQEDPFDVEIEWSSSTSGTLLVDDAILSPWTLIDGTYWFLRLFHTTATAWLLDDALSVTDTGGAPSTGKIQWWLWQGGYGYLPQSSTPGLPDPS